ncbi:hypothetical protein Pcinc_027710 [Petrolisthes cinctipes]|uniref:HTH CENPB-type domain-containing protein n=1 Tax=Petrolisthes cinctipes TaxID=88211 RepID=A0AAE1F3F2_PETCI|nr:hypothetical protein Pcinc_027710 [Petrolisthes cinctipes]
MVRGVEILTAASKLATHLGIANFKASDGWLWRFRNRHGLFKVRGEAGDVDTSSVEPFHQKLKTLIENEGLALSQVDNEHETGFYLRSMLKNSQVRKGEETDTNFKGFEAGESNTTIDDVRDAEIAAKVSSSDEVECQKIEWLDENETILGYQGVSEAEIAARVKEEKNMGESSSDEVERQKIDWLDENETILGYQGISEAEIAAKVKEEKNTGESECQKVKLSTLRTYVDALLDYTTYSKLKETASYYATLRMLRENIIKEQHMGGY